MPEASYARKVGNIFDAPTYGEAFAELVSANAQVRAHVGREVEKSKGGKKTQGGKGKKGKKGK